MYKEKIPILNFPASGVFETMRSYGACIFRLREHIDRLFESCKSAALKPPAGKAEVSALVRRALAKSKLKDAYVRVALYRINDRSSKIMLIVRPFKGYPADCYRKGVRLVSVCVKKPSCAAISPHIKSSNFLAAVVAKLEAGRSRGFEPLLTNEKGIIAEGAVSNIFIVKRGALMTSPVEVGLLNGITRQVVLKLAGRLGIDSREVPITRHNLYTADEAFLTNTIMELIPVIEADGRRIGAGRPGAITKILMKEYKDETRSKKG